MRHDILLRILKELETLVYKWSNKFLFLHGTTISFVLKVFNLTDFEYKPVHVFLKKNLHLFAPNARLYALLRSKSSSNLGNSVAGI